MATSTSRRDIHSRPIGTPLGTTAFLLAIYTAFYLLVVGILHFTSSPDAAAAITPDTTQQYAAAPNIPPETIGATGEPSAAYVAKPATAATDNSRECTPDAGGDAECVFN